MEESQHLGWELEQLSKTTENRQGKNWWNSTFQCLQPVFASVFLTPSSECVCVKASRI